MKTFGSLLMASGLVFLGCAGQPAQGGVSPLVPEPSPEAQAATSVVNTGYITTPALVSAGMTQIEAYVPAKAGATYAWSVSNGTLTGVTRNAMVCFNARTAGTVTLSCTVTLAGVATQYTQTVAVVAALPLTPFYYGSGFSADALANTVVGGAADTTVSYRFQARYTTPLNGFRVFFIWSSSLAGYNAGLGGTIRVDLMADDGSAAHLPKGPALASTTYGNIIPQENFYPKLVFGHPVALQGGALYHLVFTNIDSMPAVNYISLDNLYTNAQTGPMQPVLADADFAVLMKSGTGAWKVRQGFTPTLELDFGSGGQGNGYMEIWSTNPKDISGAAQVREAFKVSGPSRMFSKVLLRLKHLSGTSPLTVRVEEADGSLVGQVEMPAASFSQGVSTWVTVPFPLTHVLNSSVAYHLTLSSPADTVYSAYPMRKGLDKGFSTSTVFPDGYAQFTPNGAAGWTGWNMWGTSNLTDSDLQFAFVP